VCVGPPLLPQPQQRQWLWWEDVPPLQAGVVGSYPVCGTWFPGRLPLEGVWSYLDLLGHNWRIVVPGVQDPANYEDESNIELIMCSYKSNLY
jgi:hypothetical protein